MRPEDIRFASRFEGISGSAIREIFKLLAVPGMISFAGGNPSPESLPGSIRALQSRSMPWVEPVVGRMFSFGHSTPKLSRI